MGPKKRCLTRSAANIHRLEVIAGVLCTIGLPALGVLAFFEERHLDRQSEILRTGIPVQGQVLKQRKVRNRATLGGLDHHAITYRYSHEGRSFTKETTVVMPPESEAIQVWIAPGSPAASALQTERSRRLPVLVQLLFGVALLILAVTAHRHTRRAIANRFILEYGDEAAFKITGDAPSILQPNLKAVTYVYRSQTYKTTLPRPRWEAPLGCLRDEDLVLAVHPVYPERATLKMRALIDSETDWCITAHRLAGIAELLRVQLEGTPAGETRGALTSLIMRLRTRSCTEAQNAIADMDELLFKDRWAERSFDRWIHRERHDLSMEDIATLSLLRYGQHYWRQLNLRTLAIGSAVAAMICWLGLHLLFDAPGWVAAAFFAASNVAGMLLILVSHDKPPSYQRTNKA